MPAQPVVDRRRPATAAVELRGVYRRFGRTMVLAGVDLRVDEGELIPDPEVVGRRYGPTE